MVAEQLTLDLRPAISRKEARAVRLQYYFTGKFCKRGHRSLRLTKTAHCIMCREVMEQTNKVRLSALRKTWAVANKGRLATKAVAWRAANKEKIRECRPKYKGRYIETNKAWVAENREKARAAVSKWRETNPDKKKELAAAWCRRNQAKIAAQGARRRAKAKHACPQWADLKAIRAIFVECSRISRETGILHHVDHVIPLCGKNVCGLHVAANLNIIPALANLKKQNKFSEASHWSQHDLSSDSR